MSSIYKKGRDGFYYYQAYVFNSKSGKKDKKIYHSLGTKEFKTAQNKQIELDERYKRKDAKSYIKKESKLFILFLLVLVMLLFFYQINKTELILDDVISNRIEDKIDLLKIKDIELKKNQIIKENYVAPKNVDKKLESIPLEQHSKSDSLIIPQFQITTVEDLNSDFNQGKVIILIGERYNYNGLKALCENIKDKFFNFENIIICLFMKVESDGALANTLSLKKDIDYAKRNWVAMYTYNPVEGVYFDEKPTDFLKDF